MAVMLCEETLPAQVVDSLAHSSIHRADVPRKAGQEVRFKALQQLSQTIPASCISDC